MIGSYATLNREKRQCKRGARTKGYTKKADHQRPASLISFCGRTTVPAAVKRPAEPEALPGGIPGCGLQGCSGPCGLLQ